LRKGLDKMSENKQDSGADAPIEDLQEFEFHKILDCTIEELLKKAWKEQWNIKHIDFWLRVKNAQNNEVMVAQIKDFLHEINLWRPQI
jgi:hypothetical protein